jgi:hypothetical protein
MGQSKIHTFIQNKWKEKTKTKKQNKQTKHNYMYIGTTAYFRNSNDCFIKSQTVGS